MNLISEGITHKVFGEGNIVKQDGSIITIDFSEGTKKFVYPDAFGVFITLNDEKVAKALQRVISEKEIKEKALEKKREEKREQQALERQRIEKLNNLKIHESSQIVFWLDEEEQQNVFTDWQVFTGEVQSGKNKGQPNRAARLAPNSAAILTVRKSDQPETERQILGLFLVNEMFSASVNEDGMVPAHEQFRIKLTDQEAEKMLFWNYYLNTNYRHRTTWNSGKYRYFDNVWTAQILKDIIALRKDEEQIKEAHNFLEYFCEMNAIDIANIPEANGVLKQS